MKNINRGYPNQPPPNQQPYQPQQHNSSSRPPNQYQPNQYQPNQYQPNQYQQGPPPQQPYYQQGPPPPQPYYQQGPPPSSQNFGPPSPQQQQFQPQFVNQGPPGIQQPLSPQSSPSSPQNVVIQPNQQNANKKQNVVIKPSPVNHNLIPPRTHSAPPSLEEQQQQLQQQQQIQMQHQNIKPFTPADKRGPPIQHQPFVIPQQPPLGVQPFNKPMYGVPQQHQPMYGYPHQAPPYFYPQGQVVNQMVPPPTNVKKALDIVNPATNEKIVVDSSPPKSSTSSSTSPYTSTTPIATANATPTSSSSTSVGIPSPSGGNSSTTPSSSPSTGGYVTSFSSGNVNLRKNKQSGETTPTKDTTANSSTTSTPSTSTSTPIKAELPSTTSETETKSSTPTTETSSVSSTTTPEKRVETPTVATELVKPTTTTAVATEEVKPTATVAAVKEEEEEVKPTTTTTTEEKPVEANTTTTSPVVETKPVEEKVTKEEPTVPATKEESSSSSSSSSVKETSTTTSTTTTNSSDASTTTTTTNSTSTPTTNGKVEEEEEEWEKKGEEDFNILPSTDLSSSVSSTPATSLAFRNSGEKIVYSKEEMMSLKPKSMEEPSGPLKDLKNQIETNSNQNQLNRSGNKIGGQQQMQQGKNMGQQNPNYPPQMNMKYPPQMNMKYPPKNYNQQGQQQYNKYAPGYQYQQQVQQGQHGQQQQQFGQPPQQNTYGITFNREPVQQPIATAPVNEKRWIPTKVNALDDTQKLLRRANFILNKITPEKFDVLTEELLQLNIVDDEKVHKGTIDLIFDKALNESKFCTMYTNLCKKIFEFERSKKDDAKKLVFEKIGVIETNNYNSLPAKAKDDFDTEHNIKPMFRTLLLSTCQKEYEKIQFESMDKTAPEDLKPEEKSDFEENQFKERKRIFGLFKFIGELFKQQMLSEKIVHAIMVSLIGELQRPSEIKLECFCKLLSIVGKTLSTNEQASKYLTSYFLRMQQLIDNSTTLSQRIRFLIQNVVDLKNNNWIPKVDESAKTLKEVEATQNKQEDTRKSTTGVKTNTSTNMFNAAFTFGGPSKQPMIPPMNYNKNAPTLKQPAQFQAKPPYGYQNQNQNQYNNYNNMGGGNQYNNNNNNRQQQMGGKNMNMGGGMNNFNNMNMNMNMNTSNSINNTTTTTSSSPVSSEIQKKWDAVSQSVTETISEFLELKDEEEFVECIKSYVPSIDLYPNVISQLITTAVNTQKSENLIKDLIFSLVCDKKFFTQAQFKSGLEIFVAGLPDLFEDRPSAYKSVASVFYSFVVSPQEPSLVTIQQFAQSFAKILDSCSSSISKILYEFVIQFGDSKKAASLFNDNKVGIQGFFTDKDLSKITQSASSYNKDLLPFFESVKL